MANTTFNPSDKTAAVTLSGGNLIATNTTNAIGGVRAVDRQLVGRFYWEYICNVVAGNAATGVGIASPTASLSLSSFNAQSGTSGVTRSAGTIYVEGVSTGSAVGAITAGSVIGVAIDSDARLVWYRLGAAGNWNGSASANPATGAGGIPILLGRGVPIYPAVFVNGTNDQTTANFGDSAFVGAVPSGYTSGFTAGASVPTNAIASQALAEHWLTTNPQAQVTQVVAEHWASVASGNLQAVVTQVLLEHWTSVAVVVPAAGGPMVTMIH
jgi:hypothetical protein